MIALQISPKIERVDGWVGKPQNLYGILQIFEGPIWTIFSWKLLNLAGELFIQ